MFKSSDIQHQFWLTKKIVQRKLHDKEDECVIESDAQLNAKIELFTSISTSGNKLAKIVESYLDKLAVLTANENALGKFLNDIVLANDLSKTCTVPIGKAICYTSKQNNCIRPPLQRFNGELTTFNSHALKDVTQTIQAMEKERTEYRASLSWMKSCSANLDPDSGKAIQKYRKTQQLVKDSKLRFEKLERDCLEKIDLLVAARCNMLSHGLIGYQQALEKSFENTIEIFQTTLDYVRTANANPVHFLTTVKNQNEDDKERLNRTLFFDSEYNDLNEKEKLTNNEKQEIEGYQSLISDLDSNDTVPNQTKPDENEPILLLDSFINSEEMKNEPISNFDFLTSDLPLSNTDLLADLSSLTGGFSSTHSNTTVQQQNVSVPEGTWDILAELDPLSNSFGFKQNLKCGQAT